MMALLDEVELCARFSNWTITSTKSSCVTINGSTVKIKENVKGNNTSEVPLNGGVNL
jgi:hypothetical protein